MPDRIQRLAGLSLFAGADRAALELIAERCAEVGIPTGAELCHEGGPAGEFVVIVDGRALVSRDGHAIAYLGPGSGFGEMALMDGDTRTATLTALMPMRVLVFDADDFHVLIEELPWFCARLLTMVIGRLRLANAQISERAGTNRGSPSRRSHPARSDNPDS